MAGARRVWRAMAFACAIGLAPSGLAADVLRLGGSGTLLGPVEVLAEAYKKIHREASIVIVGNLGSSGGVRALLEGAVDIALASRALKPAEKEAGAVAHLLGVTPFVFVVGPGRPETAITEAELVDIYSGARTRWPDGRLIRLALRPPDDSDNATMDALSPAMQRARRAAHARAGMHFAASDQENADYLERTPGALGALGLAVVIAERRQLRPLQLNGVAPSAEALAQGRYPLQKTLYLVVTPAVSPAVRRFLDFVASPKGRALLRSAGVMPAAQPPGGR